MQADTLSTTDNPEETVALAARGDYYSGYVGDDSVMDVLDGVSVDQRHRELAAKKQALFHDVLHGQHRTLEDALDEHSIDERLSWGDQTPEITMAINRWSHIAALLDRLMHREHWGPFEHAQITITFEDVSRALMAQLTRHRHVSFDIQSQRYVNFGDKDSPIKTPQTLDPDTETFVRSVGDVDVDDDQIEQLAANYDHLTSLAMDFYEQLTDTGIPEEDARFALPIGTTVNGTMSLNLRSLLHVANMRQKADAQWEIRDFTNLVLDECLREWAPITYWLWEEHGPMAESP